jgi:hypothetical protein
MQYFVRFRVHLTKTVIVRQFDAMILRTIFVISLEGEGLGTVLEEWAS